MGTERRFNQMSAIWEAVQASKSENDKDFNVAFFFLFIQGCQRKQTKP